MAFIFKDWFFKQFPQWYHENDTYKNGLGEGLLQRYLRNFGEEIDEEVYPFIQNFMDILNVYKTPQNLLPLLGRNLGDPVNANNDPATFRLLLSEAMYIYSVKGTILSYRALFNIFGYKVAIQELPEAEEILYDNGHFYDENPAVLYDVTCSTCSGYILYYQRLNGNTVEAIDTPIVKKLIPMVEPINAQLMGLYATMNNYPRIFGREFGHPYK